MYEHYKDISVWWPLEEFIELYGAIDKIETYHREGSKETFPMCHFKSSQGVVRAAISMDIQANTKEQLMEIADILMVGFQGRKRTFVIFNHKWVKRKVFVLPDILTDVRKRENFTIYKSALSNKFDIIIGKGKNPIVITGIDKGYRLRLGNGVIKQKYRIWVFQIGKYSVVFNWDNFRYRVILAGKIMAFDHESIYTFGYTSSYELLERMYFIADNIIYNHGLEVVKILKVKNDSQLVPLDTLRGYIAVCDSVQNVHIFKFESFLYIEDKLEYVPYICSIKDDAPCLHFMTDTYKCSITFNLNDKKFIYEEYYHGPSKDIYEDYSIMEAFDYDPDALWNID